MNARTFHSRRESPKHVRFERKTFFKYERAEAAFRRQERERDLGDSSFFAPDAAFVEARQYLPGLLEKRGVSGAAALATLDALEAVVRPLDALYQPLEQAALARIGERDADDWPALACALLLDCPVWTEDADFFGTGVATWTTATVRLYLSPDDPHAGEEAED